MTPTPARSSTSCYIIAEAGVNHNGDLSLARELVDAAVRADADAVKFQTYDTDSLVTEETETTSYQQRSGLTDQYDMLRRLELSEDDFEEIAGYCRDSGVDFLSTAYDVGSVDLLESLGVDRFKIASADIVNKPLLGRVGATGDEVILSTGMATLEEIGQALGWLRDAGCDSVELLHCVSAYPADVADLNLRFIPTLQGMFDVPVGFSDHTLGTTAPVTAVALGATTVEKHFTLDRTLEGPDHEASLEPDELTEMVSAIRTSQKARGKAMKRITPEERENARQMRSSLHISTALQSGDRLTDENIEVTRPADGLEPRHFDTVLGATVNTEKQSGAPLTWSDIS